MKMVSEGFVAEISVPSRTKEVADVRNHILYIMCEPGYMYAVVLILSACNITYLYPRDNKRPKLFSLSPTLMDGATEIYLKSKKFNVF